MSTNSKCLHSDKRWLEVIWFLKPTQACVFFLFLFFFKLINLFIFGCVGSSFLCKGFL